MSKKEKLIKRLLSRPKDFTINELITLLGFFDYFRKSGGKTGGSRTVFKNEIGESIRIHKPHPGNTLKEYQIEDIIAILKERKFL